MTYEERIAEASNTLALNTSIDDSMLNDEQLHEVYQYAVAMQSEAIKGLLKKLGYSPSSILVCLTENGYIPEKEGE